MEYFSKRIKKVICIAVGIFIVALLITIISLLMLKYEVEGENNMPFELSQMVVVSTAEGIEKTNEDNLLFDLAQNNDIYLYIEKNKGYKETERIKNVIINNFKINEAPERGNVVLYKPSHTEHKNYEYNDEYIINDTLIYSAEGNTNIKEQKIANQGGVIAFRYSLKDLRRIQLGITKRRNKT